VSETFDSGDSVIFWIAASGLPGDNSIPVRFTFLLDGRDVRAIPTGFFSDELTEIPLDLQQGENRLLVKIIAARGHGLTMRYWDLQIQGQVIAPDGLLVR
jgi:hypothetical protein